MITTVANLTIQGQDCEVLALNAYSLMYSVGKLPVSQEFCIVSMDTATCVAKAFVEFSSAFG